MRALYMQAQQQHILPQVAESMLKASTYVLALPSFGNREDAP